MIVLFHLTYFVQDRFPYYLTIVHYWFGVWVQLFFFISGFSLFYGYFDRLNDLNGVKKYLVSRFLRIAPLFYTMIVFWSGLLFFTQGVTCSLGEYLINFTFLFNIIPGMANSIVPAGWTIGILFLFYLIVPILIVVIRKFSVSIVGLAGSIFVAIFYYDYMSTLGGIDWLYNYTSIITQFPFFLAGIVCYFIVKKILAKEELLNKIRIKVIGVALIISGIFITCLITLISPILIYCSHIPFAIGLLYVWGVVFICFLIGLILYPWKGVVNRVSKFLGNISYSIYLVHPVVLLLSIPVYNNIYEWIGYWDISFLISFIYTLIILLVVSFLTYKFIEKPAIKYGKSFILKKILKQKFQV